MRFPVVPAAASYLINSLTCWDAQPHSSSSYKKNIKIKANPAAIKIQHNQDILIALYKFRSRVALNNLNGILGTLAFIPPPPIKKTYIKLTSMNLAPCHKNSKSLDI